MAEIISPVNIESRKTLDLRAGDTVRVHQKIQEKGKTRLQVFEGMVLARKHGTEPGATFTVRRTAGGFGVEKIFPLYSPMIDKIEIVKRSKTRRSKLYYIRRKALKQISKRLKMMFVDITDEVKEEPKPETPEETSAESTEETTKESKPDSTSSEGEEEKDEPKEATEESQNKDTQEDK